jgi:hypothetical protein
MNPDHLADDRLTTALASLPLADVSAVHADRVRARCHAALAPPSQARRAWITPAWAAGRRVLEPALVAGASVAFLLEVVSRALSLEGF